MSETVVDPVAATLPDPDAPESVANAPQELAAAAPVAEVLPVQPQETDPASVAARVSGEYADGATSASIHADLLREVVSRDRNTVTQADVQQAVTAPASAGEPVAGVAVPSDLTGLARSSALERARQRMVSAALAELFYQHSLNAPQEVLDPLVVNLIDAIPDACYDAALADGGVYTFELLGVYFTVAPTSDVPPAAHLRPAGRQPAPAFAPAQEKEWPAYQTEADGTKTPIPLLKNGPTGFHGPHADADDPHVVAKQRAALAGPPASDYEARARWELAPLSAFEAAEYVHLFAEKPRGEIIVPTPMVTNVPVYSGPLELDNGTEVFVLERVRSNGIFYYAVVSYGPFKGAPVVIPAYQLSTAPPRPAVNLTEKTAPTSA